jgi:hypothetical protein
MANDTPQKQIKPFVAGEAVSASALESIREAVANGIFGTQALQPQYRPPFVARITGSSGAAFAWNEQGQTASDTWTTLTGGRSGTTSVNPAYELNGSISLATNTLVWMHQEIDTTGALRYWFIAPGGMFPVKVEKTSGAQGTDTTTAEFVYTVRTLAWNGTSGGETLGTDVPLSRPREIGFVTAQAGSTGYGVAFYDGLTLRLWDAGEIYGTEECPEE